MRRRNAKPAFSSFTAAGFRPRLWIKPPRQSRDSFRCPVCVAKSLEEAISKGFVKDFGRVIQLDENRYFPRENALSLSASTRAKLQPVVDLILDRCLSSEIIAIFVRGSVAAGLVQPGRKSDLDLIVLSKLPMSQRQKDAIRQEASKFARKELGFTRADLRFVVQKQQNNRQGRNSENVTWSTDFLQSNYSVVLYNNEEVGWEQQARTRPNDVSAMNIRKDERSFIRLLGRGVTAKNISLQVDAIQWICKRSLRAIADMASEITCQHARDLVPCYKLGSLAYPEYSDVLLAALQIACASSENGFAELSKDEFLKEGCKVARNLVEIVEELFIRRNFVLPAFDGAIPYSTTSPDLLPTHSSARKVNEFFSQIYAFWMNKILSRGRESSAPFYRRAELPLLALDVREQIPEGQPPDVADSSASLVSQSLEWLLERTSTPQVFRGIASSGGQRENTTAAILEQLKQTTQSVRCRVSPDNTFIFCRGSHEWIQSTKFQPPSVSLSIPTTEAIARLQKGRIMNPLYYFDSSAEHVYIQTKASGSQQLFKQEWSAATIAQEERIWISTHGSVSGLHFDASYSILVQRSGSKRMIFFPPSCLEHMGIYPLGHPLHRRARVCLTRRETAIFECFWEKCASQAAEVILREGDAVVFPPFWAHYTESRSKDRSELSISHTMRYL